MGIGQERAGGGPSWDRPSPGGEGDNRAGFDRRKRAGGGTVGTVPFPAGSLSSQPFPPFPAGIWSASNPNGWCYLSLPVSFPHRHTAASVWGQNNNQGAADTRGERPGLPAAVQDPPPPPHSTSSLSLVCSDRESQTCDAHTPTIHATHTHTPGAPGMKASGKVYRPKCQGVAECLLRQRE